MWVGRFQVVLKGLNRSSTEFHLARYSKQLGIGQLYGLKGSISKAYSGLKPEEVPLNYSQEIIRNEAE